MVGIFPECRRAHLTVLVEDTIELAEGGESALLTNLLDGFLAVEQFILCMSDTDHLQVGDKSSSGDQFELSGKIIRADGEPFCNFRKTKSLIKMSMHITGDCIDFLTDRVCVCLLDVLVLSFMDVQYPQQFHETLVDHHLSIEGVLSPQLVDSVQQSVDIFKYFTIKAKNGHCLSKKGEQSLRLPLEPFGVFLDSETDDQAGLWFCMLLIGALME